MGLSGRRLQQLQSEFYVDSHDLWEQEDDSRQARLWQEQWNDNREKVQTQMETMGSKDESEDNRACWTRSRWRTGNAMITAGSCASSLC